MTRLLFLTAIIFFSKPLLAKTPSTVVVGAIVNSWTQAGLRVTDKLFDLAVQGNGFFILRLPSGVDVYSRHGEMSVDPNGFLIHTASQAKVLGFCKGGLQPINLAGFATDKDGAVVKSFQTKFDGAIKAYYENGYMHETCTVALARFQNSPKLLRSGHLLQATEESGAAFLGLPQKEGLGSLYAGTLEELDEEMYQINIR